MPSRINHSSPHHPYSSPNTLTTSTLPKTIDRPYRSPPSQETSTPNPRPSPRPPQQGPSRVTPPTIAAARIPSSGNRHPSTKPSPTHTSNTASPIIASNDPTVPTDTSTFSDAKPSIVIPRTYEVARPSPSGNHHPSTQATTSLTPSAIRPSSTAPPSIASQQLPAEIYSSTPPVQPEDSSPTKAPVLSAISNVILRGLETGERSPHASIGLFIDLITILAHGQELTEGQPFPELQAQIQHLKYLQSHWSESSDQQA